MTLFSLRPKLNAGGFTLVDVMGAILVIGLSLTGLMAANSRSAGIVKSAKQAAVASKCLQQRIEQLRNYNWPQLTDAGALVELYSTPPLPSVELPGFSEQVTVSGFTAPTGCDTVAAAPSGTLLQLQRDVNGTVTLVTDNPDLVDGFMVRVDVQISWPGPNGRARMRETSVIISNGGIGR